MRILNIIIWNEDYLEEFNERVQSDSDDEQYLSFIDDCNSGQFDSDEND